VSGRSLGEVQHLVETVLRGQFRGVDAMFSSRIRTVRVYVAGDVERPGAYDVSSLSTPLNALYTAGGPTAGGSLRILRHYRGQQLVQEVRRIRSAAARYSGGPAKTAGRRHRLRSPAQRRSNSRRDGTPPRHPMNCAGKKAWPEVLELAGGVLPSGTLRHVDVERVESHQGRTMLRLDIPETDSDANVAQALDDLRCRMETRSRSLRSCPMRTKTVYLDGHVSRPGKFAYRDGMKVTDLIKSYKDLLPEPSTNHAEIIRLSQPGLHARSARLQLRRCARRPRSKPGAETF